MTVIERFPLGAQLRLADLERFDNAAPLHRLREHEPVTWFAEQGVWLVTSKRLVDAVQMDPVRFVVDVPRNPQRIVLGDQMLVVDGEEHSFHRGPFAPSFRHSAVREAFTDTVAERVEQLLDAVAGAGVAELGAAFANPFAVSVASDVLGLGLEHVEEVHDIYTAFAEGMVGYQDPDAVARAARARERLAGFLVPRIEHLRISPDGSLLSSVIQTGNAGLSDDEKLMANLRLILFGAIETVESMILNTTWALLHHPAEVRRLREKPDLWPAAVQEGLRWIPPVGYTDRWASQDTELGGACIARGDYVIPVIHAANRDPNAFSDPDHFDITRGDNRQNLSFGKGIHMCLGVNLARIQGATALCRLFERLAGLRLDETRPSEPRGFNFRRPPHLHVKWDSAPHG
ncbi:MAG: cytochrome P450 [Solirubrobacteraceae bacterium]